MLGALEFVRERWGYRFRSRAALRRHQARRLRRLLAGPAQRTRALAGIDPATPLERLPRTTSRALKSDPGEYLAADFDAEAAIERAVEAERDRRPGPVVDGIAIGVSSGTSGRRGLFAVDARERARWSATILARAIPPRLLRRIASPWAPPVRIALALRSASELYEAVRSGRVDFRFVDLVQPYGAILGELEGLAPDVLVAPASVLGELARDVAAARATLAPSLAIAVAEPLDDAAAGEIARAFGAEVRQIYQATEGLLAVTCDAGALHLLEEHCIIEPDWLDATRTRFAPLVTDLARTTQISVRRRLDDVLRIHPDSLARCRCGRRTRRIAAIDGRADEILELPAARSAFRGRIFPDQLRRAFLAESGAIGRWQVLAAPSRWQVGIEPAAGVTLEEAAAAAELAIVGLCAALALAPPALEIVPWTPPEPGAKLVRVRRCVS